MFADEAFIFPCNCVGTDSCFFHGKEAELLKR